MEVKAAVAHAAGEPLKIETVELEGPREGEVLVEVKATGVCHTDAYTLSGADPEGLFPTVMGHEGCRASSWRSGPGVKSLKEGRPRHPALHAGVPGVRVLFEPEDQPVPGHPDDAGARRDARRDEPALAQR
jgi:hypothetical protein